jgi:hypothetical protein
VWQLIRLESGDLRLTAVAHAVVWPPMEAPAAACARARHEAPQTACTCGYYSSRSIEDLAAAGVFARGVAVIGTISMWGRLVEHARGARSRYAYPSRLRLVCSPCLQLGSIVDPVTVAGGTVLIPLCDGHWRSRGEGHDPAPAVQAEVLSTYGVDLLPMPAVTTFRRRAGDLAPAVPRSRPRSWAGAVAAIWLLIRVLSGIGVPEDAIAGSTSSPVTAVSSGHVGIPTISYRFTEAHRGAVPRVRDPGSHTGIGAASPSGT